MASCHFNMFMNELGIKVRAAISTAVYRLVKESMKKFLTASSHELKKVAFYFIFSTAFFILNTVIFNFDTVPGTAAI